MAQVEVTATTKCRVIERHIPDADVAYRPGQDVVAGKPVAPADLEGSASPVTVPQNFEIEVDADLGASVAGPRSNPLYNPNAKIGRVQVGEMEGDTSIQFNGQPLYKAPSGTSSPDCAQ
ncbi:MAG: hypothetical protein Dbin4_02858 [Alphaproteobacteria bacterium]|nr:hypothetical protein [Alphaproteobacteria bacterium]